MSRRLRVLWTAAALAWCAVALAACAVLGSDDGPAYDDTAALAAKVGCTDHLVDPPDTLRFGASETGTCTAPGGQPLSLATFPDGGDSAGFVDVMRGLGEGCASSARWAVCSADPAAVEQASRRVR